MKNIILKIGIFLLGLICLRVQAVDIPVTTVSGIDAAITQANATTAVDRIVLRIPGFAYGTRITATIMITQPLVIDGSELTGYQKYFPVAELALPSRDTSKSITIKGLAVNTAYQLTNNVGPNTIRNNMAFVDCNVFNVGNSLSFDDRSVMIKHVRKVSFKGCVFNYYLFLNKTQFGKGDVYERITVYKSADVVFGGNTESEANVIVGFHKKGVFLYKCKNVQFNTNYIGVLPAALAALPIVITYHTDTYTITDGQDGIYLSTCHQITIGGGSSGQSTVIGNMATNGIYMTKCSDITIQNSKIGVAADGVTRTANMNGIVAASPLHKYSGNASTELLGWQGSESDTDPAWFEGRCIYIKIIGNVISGNKLNGVQLGSTDSLIISNNKIGTDISGKLDVGNGWKDSLNTGMGDGINLFDCSKVYIGGEVKQAGATIYYQGNIIGYNSIGIALTRTQKARIENNRIGINPFVGSAIPNRSHGIAILDTCTKITVGPQKYDSDTYYSSRNIIGGNKGDGVYIYGYATQNNWISFNTFGYSSISNGHNNGYGIHVYRASNNLIGNRSADLVQVGNIFYNNASGHIKLEYSRNNFMVLNNYKPSQSNLSGKYINISLTNSAAISNYGSKAPTITSITEGSNNTLIVKGTSVLASEFIELYSFSSQYGNQPLKQTTSSGGLWEIILDASVPNVSAILKGGVEGSFVALASCSNSCQGAFVPTATLYHNTSEFGVPFSIKLNKYDCVGCVESFKPSVGVTYVLGAWVKEQVAAGTIVNTYDKAGIKIGFNGNSLQTQTYRAKGKLIDGWQRIEQEFKVPEGAADITITLVNDGAPNVYYDDVRIHPLEGEMKSYVYDPFTQKLTAELDENNYATFYEYDKEGTLVRVKKETERGVYTIKETRMHQAEK